MPATAGRVRMPANNRVHSSAALQTHGIWQSAIGYDPYAPNKEDKKDTSQSLPNDEPDGENAYASFQGLLQLAKITNADVDVSRGACKRCGRVGHLKFQCKNYVKIKDENEEKNLDMSMGLVGLDKKLKGKADRRSNVESSEEEEDSESSDSEVDSEIERIIAQRSGKKISGKGGSFRKKGDLDDDDDSDKKRKKRGRSKKRSGKREVSDSDDSSERGSRRRKRRREHRRKRDKSSDEDDEHRRRRRKSRKEKRRRRSRPSDSDSESSEDLVRHKRKSKRASSSSDSDIRGYNDSRIGRDVNKSEKRRRHRDDDE
ncbi:PREDICTED: CAX-interacting protein 4-like [Lupinus angustifolius]|uniref:CAX-interacting protein 4-like n=1 Tax=Lupinus angustifolius TaxID=3871 RepID=UPI00092F6F58|nr:PREDICTED: CAX-interacting protein 4-like [Lupinus angustifolius]XP_019441696.1 PREDICTED: CAX-interacting protein 4-like [Lupinus angustifolius]XP_019441698.1 PREDICTED: CAX-interacting protein 4-like [Lupinus angustifolius]